MGQNRAKKRAKARLAKRREMKRWRKYQMQEWYNQDELCFDAVLSLTQLHQFIEDLKNAEPLDIMKKTFIVHPAFIEEYSDFGDWVA